MKDYRTFLLCSAFFSFCHHSTAMANTYSPPQTIDDKGTYYFTSGNLDDTLIDIYASKGTDSIDVTLNIENNGR